MYIIYYGKVSTAVFLAATMLTSGQSALDTFSEKVESKDLMRQAQIFRYANGNNQLVYLIRQITPKGLAIQPESNQGIMCI
ncbi:putative methylesterase 11, chloroplastic [Orobanche hederae]